MDAKIFITVLVIVLLAAVYYVLEDELFEFMTDPDNQVEIGQAVGVTRASDRRKQEAEQNN
ncbi:MAG: hypothetical protein ACKN9T_12740 [Candidatus Methylumidiphilus sp.]